MKKLTLGQKLLFTNILYIAPIVTMIWMLYEARTDDIHFAETEIVGNEYEAPLISMLGHVSRHRMEAQRAIHGMKEARQALPPIQKAVEEDLIQLQALDRNYGALLKFVPEELAKRKEDNFSLSKVQAQWGEIKSKLDTYRAGESNDAHAALIADLRGMITHLGNSSNLILDPDLDSYYLTDATLGGLPQMIDRIQEITTYAEPFMRVGQLRPETRAQLLVYSVQLQGDLDRVTADVQTALQEDASSHGLSESLQSKLPPVTRDLTQAVSGMIAHLKDLAEGKSIPVVTFLSGSNKAFEQAVAHWEVAAPEDTILLQARTHDLGRVRSRYVWGGSLVLLLAGLASFFVGKSLRKDLMDSLTGAVRDLSRTSGATNQTSNQILENARKLSASATQQAAAIQQTVSALSQINAMVGKSRDNAVQSVEVVKDGQRSAVEGSKAVDAMVSAMSDISSSNDEILAQTEQSNRKIEEIVKVISEIGNKTKVINDIVFQTKLLSFNASVEAARAGEHGKGFAVVAEEVGNLAQMSGNAAKEIADMLQNSTEKVVSIVSENKTKVSGLITQGRAKIEGGRQTAQRCRDVLNQIVSSVEDVSARVNEIGTAANEQARGVEEITRAMQQLDESTQENAQMSNEASGFATDLTQQANGLQGIVNRIEGEVLGGGVKSKATQAAMWIGVALWFGLGLSPIGGVEVAHADECAVLKAGGADCDALRSRLDLSGCGEFGKVRVNCHGDQADVDATNAQTKLKIRLRRAEGGWGSSDWNIEQVKSVARTAVAKREPAETVTPKLAPVAAAPLVPTPVASAAPEKAASPAAPSVPLVQFSGTVDLYYAHNFNQPRPVTLPSTSSTQSAMIPSGQNSLHFNDAYANQLGLNLAELTVKVQRKETSFLMDLDFGQMADFNAQTLVANTSGNTSVGAVDEVSKHIGQAVFTYSPETVPGLVIDAGKMPSHVGLETVKAKDNWNYSRSALFAFGGPAWHTGFHLGYPVAAGKLTAGLYLYNGWNTLYENNAAATYGAQLKFTPSDSFTWIYNYLGGPEQANNTSNWRQVHETNAVWTLSSAFSLAADLSLGSEKNAPLTSGAADATWGGGEVLLRWQISPKFSLSPRVEVYRDFQGYTLGGPAQTLTDYTLTSAIQMSEGFETRFELRHDHSSYDQRFGTADGYSANQTILLMGILYSF